VNRPRASDWIRGSRERVDAPCGCRAVAVPSRNLETGREGWTLALIACADHVHVDAREIGDTVFQRMLEQEPNTTLAALLASALDEVQTR
jgi:hypothetical protein